MAGRTDDTRRRQRAVACRALGCLALMVAAGCGRDVAAPALPPPEAVMTDEATQPPAGGSPPATLPSLAALDRQVTWVDRPVRDPRPPAGARDEREPPAPAAVTRDLGAGIDCLNPLLADTAAEFDIAELTGLCLFGFDRGREPFANADTVTSWKTSTDGLVDKVVLRGDLTWSDGTPVSARDVAFTWRLLVDPQVPARAFRGGASRLRAVVAGDDRTVVFFHEEPLATGAWNIDFPVLPRHAYARSWERDPSLVASPAHRALETRPVTGGPYEVAARTTGGEIVLRRRAGWSTVRGRRVREPAPVAEIRFRPTANPAAALEALRAGDLDVAVLDPPDWADDTSDEAFMRRAARLATPESRTLQIAWNLGVPPFADRRVRRAMGYAFDHGRLRDTLCHGLAAPAGGVFPPDWWPTAPRVIDPGVQDLDKAEALLDESGWIDHDGDGVRDREIDGRLVPCTFTVLCDRRPFRVEICALLRDCLARVGVTCIVEPVEPEALRERLEQRTFEACLVSWGDGVDPDAAESLWSTAGARNVCGYSNPDIDRLFIAGRRDRDPRRRAEHYARIEEILADDQPAMWLVREQELLGISRRVAGDLLRVRGAAHWSPGLSSIRKPTLD